MKKPMMTKFGLAIAGACFASSLHAHSDEIVCGTTYVVEKADSLTNISEWAYGTSQHYDKIYEANIDVIGSDQGNLAIGMSLDIPCLEEEGAGSALASANKTADDTGETSTPDLAAMADDLLTVDGFDAEKVVALIQTADLPESEKITLSDAVVVAKDDPVVLRHVLDHLSNRLGL